VSDEATSILQPFILELIFWRNPTEDEVEDLVREVRRRCQDADGTKHDVRDLASLLVKTGDPRVVIPSILPAEDGTRISISKVIPSEPNRQILVRAPFADQRAEHILKLKARQLPNQESGLVMVDVAHQPTAFDSWPELISRRFTTTQHTRVAGVLLFSEAITLTSEGLKLVLNAKLIINPHARQPLKPWLIDVVDQIRQETLRLTGYAD